MRKARLILGTANSVPVGTTDDDIESIYQQSFKPYLRAVYKADTIPVTVHLSGYLLNWLEKHHSEYTDVLAEMVGRKQVELLGGGFYDPVLALIPRPDRIGQIERLTTHLRKRFGRRPRGIWVTEHVWEPSLAATLQSSGMDYAFLDDYHFITGGFTGEDLCRPCITEDQGKTIVVFPVCHDLLQVARAGEPGDVIEFLRAHSSEDPTVVSVMIDDGERYTEAPARSKRASAGKGWMERLMDLLAENREWIDVVLPSQHLKDNQPRTRGYFQSAAYEEMMYWSLTPERQEAYEGLRRRFADDRSSNIFGGRFRQFLTQYPESNLMYAKMQYAHVLVNQIRGDRYRKQAAREELWRGQSHFAYWHGRHGGIYQNGLRKQIYHSLIEAEKITRERGIFIPSVVTVDFDMDGLPEYLYQGQDINAYIHQEGGHLFELDHLPVGWNYLDTLSRRPESYHTAKVKTGGYDKEMRKSFMDRFLSPAVTIEEYEQSDYVDLGAFTQTLYERTDYKREGKRLGLRGMSTVDPRKQGNSGSRPSGSDRPVSVTIDKRYTFKRSAIQVDYTLTNSGEHEVSSVFAPEINIAFLSQEADSLRLFLTGTRRVNSEISPMRATYPGAKEIRMQDLVNGLTVILSMTNASEMWCLPVETVSGCPSGTESIYQGTCLVPRFKLAIAPGESFSATIALSIE
jgi:4-alpha-glucanotransferase